MLAQFGKISKTFHLKCNQVQGERNSRRFLDLPVKLLWFHMCQRRELLSTMHHDKAVEGEMKKPEIITHYNAHKGGVDNMDHLVGTYSVKRKCNRWPMVLFFNLIDVAALASYIVWLCNFPNWRIQKRCSRRRLFLQMLGEELVEDLLQERL
jgi:Transposase IS4